MGRKLIEQDNSGDYHFLAEPYLEINHIETKKKVRRLLRSGVSLSQRIRILIIPAANFYVTMWLKRKRKK